MKHNPEVSSIVELDGGWLVTVKLDGAEYQVGVGRDYFQKLATEGETVEQLVLRSFDFLLEREPSSAIISRFELPVIQQYFPEYEQTMSESQS